MGQANLAHEMDSYFDDKIEGNIVGKIKHIEEREGYQLLTLKDNIISINSNQNYSPNNDSIVKFYSNGIQVYNNYPITSKIGNSISINGEIIKYQKASNPGQFDEYQYNKTLRYDYKVYCDSAEILSEEYSVYYDFLYRIKNKIFNVYDTILPEKNSGVLSAMILGDKATLDKDIKELYQTHGISHILAISGLHVSLIGMSLYKLLRKLSLKIPFAVILSLVFIYSYGILTNFSVSTKRAIIMLFFLLISKVIGRTYDLVSVACLSGLIILIENPLQIYSVGFLLSYGAILGIGLVYPNLSKVFQINNKVLKLLFDSILISLSVQIMTLPILIYFFFEISTYSILFNIILVPFVTIIIILAIIGGLIGIVYMPLAPLFLGGVYYILNFYEWILNVANYLPLHTLIMGRPSPSIIITYYFILFLFIILNYWKEKKHSHFLLILLLIIFIPHQGNNLEVIFLDVGQGDSIFIESKDGTRYLFDGGSSSVKEVGKYRLVPFLKSNGISKLDYVFISHFDKDHVNGVLEIMEEMDPSGSSNSISIETLVLGNSRNQIKTNDVREISEDDLYVKCLDIAKENGIKLVYMEQGDYIKEDDLLISCLSPKGSYSSNNENSMILDINYKDFNLLLTGDIEGQGEVALNEVLLELSKKEQGYDILKVAHHGSKNSTSNEFLSIVGPKHAVISSGKNNSYGHPHQELLDRLKETNSKIYTTTNEGAITVITDGKLMQIESFLGK